MTKEEEFEFIFGEDPGGFGTPESNILLIILGVFLLLPIIIISTAIITLILR